MSHFRNTMDNSDLAAAYYAQTKRPRKLSLIEREAQKITLDAYKQLNYFAIGLRPTYHLSFEQVCESAKQDICGLWDIPNPLSPAYLAQLSDRVKQDARDFAKAFMRTNLLAVDQAGCPLSAEMMVQQLEILQNVCDPLSRVCQDLVDIMDGHQKPIETVTFDRIGNIHSHFSGRIAEEYNQCKILAAFVTEKTFRLVQFKQGVADNVGHKALAAVENMITYDDKCGLPAFIKFCAMLFQMIVLLFQKETVTKSDYTRITAILANWIRVRRGL